MRYFKSWAVGVLAAAIVLGCGPAKELPDETPAPRQTSSKPVEPGLKVPTVSDADAKAYIDRAIKVFTQDDPSRLTKGKQSKSTCSGSMKLPIDPSMGLASVPTDRSFIARWPDDVKVAYKHKSGLVAVNTLVMRSGLIGSYLNNEPKSIPNPKASEEIMRTDTLAQHWLPLMFPLTEPSAVVFDLRKGVGTPPADLVRFTMPGRPVYQLTFDAANGYLTKVEYNHIEFDVPTHKSWTFSAHKPFDGLILPTRMEYIHSPERVRSKEIVEDWTVDVWEFPQKLDDSAFDPPK